MKQTFTLKKWRRNFYIFLSGQFVSGITSMVVQYAIIWYLTKATGSATVLSLATLLGMLPMALLSPFVGPLIDRWPKKPLLIITDMIVALFAIALSVVGTLAASFPLWLVFVSLFIRSVAQTFQMPTIQSILPTIVPKDQLTKVNGQLGTVQSANFIIAPALGAFLYAIVPMNFLILIDVLGAILGSGLLLLVALPTAAPVSGKIHLLADSKLGLQKLRQNQGLWYITLIGAFFTLIAMPAFSLYPLMTMDYFHGSVGDAGLIEVIYSVGTLAGSAFIGIFGNWTDRMKPILLSYGISGLTIAMSGLLPGHHRSFIYFIILNMISGLATPFFNTLLMAMIQESYPPKYLGRILGVLNALMNITGPVGLIFAGPLADTIGVEKIFIIAGVGTLLCGLVTFLVPKARRYDQQLRQKQAAVSVEDVME